MKPKNKDVGPKVISRKEKAIMYFKKLGWVGFFFFLGKGLLWLIIPYLAAKGLIDCKG
jgi:hypothetical protein